MEALRRHFKLHGAIHAMWIIACLLATIAALLLIMPNGSAVGEYIAFAASIASLVLAVVAIGQTLIANQSFSETIGSLKAVAENVEKTAQNIAGSSASLSQQSEALVSHAEKLPTALASLSDKIDKTIFAEAEVGSAKTATDTIDPGTLKILERSRFGTRIILYLLARAAQSAKSVDALKVFGSEKTDDKIWSGILAGHLLAIQAFEPCGLKVEQAKDEKGELTAEFKVTSFGTLNGAEIITYINEKESGDAAKKKADEYFS